MPVTDPAALERHAFFSRQPPTMSEAEWRAAGWKAAPTRYQLQRPLDGLCYDCKFVRGTGRFGRKKIFLVSALAAGAVLFLTFLLLRSLF